MCVIIPCADPTVPGVYWRENDRWVQYPAALAHKIMEACRNRGQNQGSLVQLGTLASAVHPRGDVYAVNIDSMQQRNARSGYQRDVKIVQEGDDTASDGVVGNALQVQGLRVWGAPVQHNGTTDQHGWVQYSLATSRRIISAFTGGQSQITLTAQDGSRCVVDTTRMQSVHYPPNSSGARQVVDAVAEDTGFEADGQQSCSICCGPIVAPHQLLCGHVFCGTCINKWTATTIARASAGGNTCPFRCPISQHCTPTPLMRSTQSFVGASRAVDASYACQNSSSATVYALRLVVPSLQDVEYQAMLEKVSSLVETSSSQFSKDPRWRTVTQSLTENLFVTGQASTLLKRFVEAACDMSSPPQIEVVFHGSPAGNIPSICKDGLDPTRRKRGSFGIADYFGVTMDTALGFATPDGTGKQSVVKFLLIKNAPGVQAVGQHVFTCCDAKYELPIGTIVRPTR